MAVAFNNSNVFAVASGASSLSAAQSVTAGPSNLCAVVDVNTQDGTSSTIHAVTTITYNSVAMTAPGAAATSTQGNSGMCRSYTLPAPATGSNTLAVSVDNGATGIILASLVSYSGVDQTTPVRASTYVAVNGSAASASTVSQAVTSAVGDRTHSLAAASPGSASIASTNQTQRNIDVSSLYDVGNDDAAGAASVTHTWTWGASIAGRMFFGFSLQPPSSGPTQVLMAQACA